MTPTFSRNQIATRRYSLTLHAPVLVPNLLIVSDELRTEPNRADADLQFGHRYIFPFKNKVVRWNNEVLYLYKSPVGYTSVPYQVGGKGWVFHSSMELAF